jgi:CheY-like chemotaxis protein
MQTCIVAEVDPFVAALLTRFLEENGWAVTRVRTGQELLDLARKMSPLLVVLDPELPGMLRGWEVARTFKEDPVLSKIPIIACSWLDAAEVSALIGAHVFGHLQKPDLHYDEVSALLQRAYILAGSSSSCQADAPE